MNGHRWQSVWEVLTVFKSASGSLFEHPVSMSALTVFMSTLAVSMSALTVSMRGPDSLYERLLTVSMRGPGSLCERPGSLYERPWQSTEAWVSMVALVSIQTVWLDGSVGVNPDSLTRW
jgi:hypothetical protein